MALGIVHVFWILLSSR